MAINEREGHRARQRSKVREFGLWTMQDYEIVELLLFYAIPRSDTKPLAHRLIRRFGSLYGVLSASEEELRSVEGVGASTALLLRLFFPLWQRTIHPASDVYILDTEERAGAYFCDLLRGMKSKCLYAAALDAKGKLISCRCMCTGNETLDLRALVRFANRTGASHVALAQYRSGDVYPSGAEFAAVERVGRALAPYGIRMPYYMFVNGDRYCSPARLAMFGYM